MSRIRNTSSPDLTEAYSELSIHRNEQPNDRNNSVRPIFSVGNTSPRPQSPLNPTSPPRRSTFLSAFIASPSRTSASASSTMNTSSRSSSNAINGPRAHSRLSKRTDSGQIGSDFRHHTMVCFKSFPLPKELNDDEEFPSDYVISRLMDQFGMPKVTAFYSPTLNMHGRTKRGEDPEIGPAAFSKTLPGVEMGPSTGLDNDMVKLQVALTIAHELTHVNQIDAFSFIELEGKEEQLNKMLPAEQHMITQAEKHQRAVLETLAYHSEVCNIRDYIAANNNLPEGKLEQINAMRDVSIYQRDLYFVSLPSPVAESFSEGDIERALETIREDVPVAFIRAAETQQNVSSNSRSSSPTG